MEEGFASPKSELRNPASCKKVGLRHAGDGDGRSYDRNVRPEHLQQENYQIPTSCCRQESGLVLITHSPYRVSIRRLGTVNASKSKAGNSERHKSTPLVSVALIVSSDGW